MKFKILIFALYLSSCNSEVKNNRVNQDENKKSGITFFVGTYTEEKSEGIYQFQLSADGNLDFIKLAAKSNNPSFLTFSSDKKFLVAINEINENQSGTVELFKYENDTLILVNRQKSGGAHPCFVSCNLANYLLTANYTGGNVGLLKINHQELSPLLFVQQHTGKGSTPRQEAPHAHSAWFLSQTEIASVDLGTNEIWFSTLDTVKNTLVFQYKLLMPEGAGPRHLAVHSNSNLYVVNELNSSISLLKKSTNNKYIIQQTISTLPGNFNEPNTCAHIQLSPDEKFVYASNRGHNSIAIFEINRQNGELKFIAHEPTRGNSPRNFNISPCGKFLLVANQKSNSIVSFLRDKKTGLLIFKDQIESFTPVCILF